MASAGSSASKVRAERTSEAALFMATRRTLFEVGNNMHTSLGADVAISVRHKGQWHNFLSNGGLEVPSMSDMSNMIPSPRLFTPLDFSSPDSIIFMPVRSNSARKRIQEAELLQITSQVQGITVAASASQSTVPTDTLGADDSTSGKKSPLTGSSHLSVDLTSTESYNEASDEDREAGESAQSLSALSSPPALEPSLPDSSPIIRTPPSQRSESIPSTPSPAPESHTRRVPLSFPPSLAARRSFHIRHNAISFRISSTRNSRRYHPY